MIFTALCRILHGIFDPSNSFPILVSPVTNRPRFWHGTRGIRLLVHRVFSFLSVFQSAQPMGLHSLFQLVLTAAYQKLPWFLLIDVCTEASPSDLVLLSPSQLTLFSHLTVRSAFVPSMWAASDQ